MVETREVFIIQLREHWPPSGSQDGGWRRWGDDSCRYYTLEEAQKEMGKIKNWSTYNSEREYRLIHRVETLIDACALGAVECEPDAWKFLGQKDNV